MKLFLVGQRRTFEVVDYNRETHVAVLRNEKGEEFIDSNFHLDIIRRVYTLEQRED